MNETFVDYSLCLPHFAMPHNASQCFNMDNTRPLLRPPLHPRSSELLLLLHYLKLPRIYSSPPSMPFCLLQMVLMSMLLIHMLVFMLMLMLMLLLMLNASPGAVPHIEHAGYMMRSPQEGKSTAGELLGSSGEVSSCLAASEVRRPGRR